MIGGRDTRRKLGAGSACRQGPRNVEDCGNVQKWAVGKTCHGEQPLQQLPSSAWQQCRVPRSSDI